MIFSKLGNILQKALFSTTLGDIVESIDGLRARIEELNKKLDREVGSLKEQLDEMETSKKPGKRPPH